MKHLGTFSDKDIFPNREVLENIIFEPRITGKVILINEIGQIALIGNKVNNFYVLPGGGVTDNETVEQGILRECLEETGYKVKIESEIGLVEEYRTRDQKHYFNYCFLAKVSGTGETQQLTQNEKNIGLKLEWFVLPEVKEIFKKQLDSVKTGDVTFYNTAFNIARDNIFLETAFNFTEEN